jgi:predicted nuclease of restriction endonuclease-like (RecB) superfamily
VVKDPYVFEFLNLPDRNYRESELENRLIAELEKFLLELGKGFAFIGQQYGVNRRFVQPGATL